MAPPRRESQGWCCGRRGGGVVVEAGGAAVREGSRGWYRGGRGWGAEGGVCDGGGWCRRAGWELRMMPPRGEGVSRMVPPGGEGGGHRGAKDGVAARGEGTVAWRKEVALARGGVLRMVSQLGGGSDCMEEGGGASAGGCLRRRRWCQCWGEGGGFVEEGDGVGAGGRGFAQRKEVMGGCAEEERGGRMHVEEEGGGWVHIEKESGRGVASREVGAGWEWRRWHGGGGWWAKHAED